MSKMSRPKKSKTDSYYKTLIGESVEDLGTSIHTFRTLAEKFSEHAETNTYEGVSIQTIDDIYQTALDEIFDKLLNVADLKASNVALTGIQKSMLIKRGFIKKSKAFE